MPAAQGAHVEGAAAPTKALNLPAAQRVQAVTLAAPVSFVHVPAGQGAGAPEPAGQKPPAVHTLCRVPLPLKPAPQKKPVSQKKPAHGNSPKPNWLPMR